MQLINVQRAFLKFWQQFGVPAYLDGHVIEYDSSGTPQTPKMPYITFSFSRDDFFTSNLVTGRVWTRSTSFTQVLGILKQIEMTVPATGALVKLDNDEGAISIYRGAPFMQYQPAEDQTLKVGYVLLEARSYVI